ncbi:MAG: aldo/keto reductase [Vicinamibacterales bacterium]
MQHVTMEGIPVPVSRVVLGTDWCDARRLLRIGGRRIALPGADARKQAHVFDVFDAAIDAGYTAFDTARHYAGSEDVLGAWLRRRGLRDRVVLITKGGHPGPAGEPRLSAAHIAADLEASRRRLGVDCLDLYLLHRDDEATAVEPILDALQAHVARGHVRRIGVSNWRRARVEAARAAAAARGLHGFTASSLQLSLADWVSTPWPGARSVSGASGVAEREWYRAQPLWFLAYSSLAMGFFSDARSADPVDQPPTLAAQTFDSAVNRERRTRVRHLAGVLGVTAGQVALAWVLHELPRALAVVGSRQPAAAADAAAACAVALTEAERQWLDSGGPTPPGVDAR